MFFSGMTTSSLQTPGKDGRRRDLAALDGLRLSGILK
jgi:hypothetical protein